MADLTTKALPDKHVKDPFGCVKLPSILRFAALGGFRHNSASLEVLAVDCRTKMQVLRLLTIERRDAGVTTWLFKLQAGSVLRVRYRRPSLLTA